MAKEEITDEVVTEEFNEEEVQDVLGIDESPELSDDAEGADTEKVDNSPEGQLKALEFKRMGEFKITATVDDIKYFKNMLNKTPWTGSNEAYLVALSYASLDGLLASIDKKVKERLDVNLQAPVIEALNYFLSKMVGIGKDSANRCFSATMQLRQAVNAITVVQGEIEALRTEIKNSEKTA